MNRILSSCVLGFFLMADTLAQDAPTPAATEPAGNPFGPWMGILLMLAVFFFLIILPQSRKAKKQAQFLQSLKRGDSVVTQSGLYGKIYGIADRIITLEIAPNVRIRVDRQSIAALDTTPGESNKNGTEAA